MVTDIHDVPIESIIQQVMWISPQYMKRDMKLAEKCECYVIISFRCQKLKRHGFVLQNLQKKLDCKRHPCFFFFLVLREFCDLLEQQSSIEDYTDWISSLICRCVVKVTFDFSDMKNSCSFSLAGYRLP